MGVKNPSPQTENGTNTQYEGLIKVCKKMAISDDLNSKFLKNTLYDG